MNNETQSYAFECDVCGVRVGTLNPRYLVEKRGRVYCSEHVPEGIRHAPDEGVISDFHFKGLDLVG